MLYHGSVQKGLSELHPRDGKLFASPDFRVAAIFLAGAQRASCWPINGRIYAFIGDNREELLSRDCGGSVYVVPKSQFRPYPGGNPSLEWVAKDTVTPIMSFAYESSFAAIIAHGVQLYFVGLSRLDQIEAAGKKGSLLGAHMLVSILAEGSENDRLRTWLSKRGPTPSINAETSLNKSPQM